MTDFKCNIRDYGFAAYLKKIGYVVEVVDKKIMVSGKDISSLEDIIMLNDQYKASEFSVFNKVLRGIINEVK